MKTITITEAKRQLGSYLKRAAAGEEIGIISGADIISLRKTEVVSARLREEPQDPYALDIYGGGSPDAAANHDQYLYDRKSRQPRK